MRKNLNIHHFLNLKIRLVESLKSQGVKDSWIMPSIIQTGLHQIYKEDLKRS